MSFAVVEIEKNQYKVDFSWGQLQQFFCHTNIIGLNSATLNKTVGISLVDEIFIVALGFEYSWP